MGTENQTPGSDLQSVLAGLGISGSLGTGPYADPADREVIWDWRNLEQEYLGAGVEPGRIPRPLPKPPELKRESEAEKHLYSMPDEEVGELQRRLWAGGFYPAGARPDEIALGDRDPYTEKAWLSAIDRAAKFRAAGREVSIWDVIDMGANLEGAKGRGGGPGTGGGAGERAPLVSELTNPEDLKYYAQKTAVSALGRGLRPDELERFVSSFHASQQTAQTQAYNAAGGTGGAVVAAPSVGAAAESFARQAAPSEAGAHDFVKVYDVVSRLLGGRRGNR